MQFIRSSIRLARPGSFIFTGRGFRFHRADVLAEDTPGKRKSGEKKRMKNSRKENRTNEKGKKRNEEKSDNFVDVGTFHR